MANTEVTTLPTALIITVEATDSGPCPGGLQVIAAGLPRCATSSLKEAFEKQLDIGPCMHMNRCVLNPDLMQIVHDAIVEDDTEKRRALLRKLFEGYSCSSDFPGQFFLEDLVEMYPNAKFVLNLRKGGGEQWLKSVKPTIGKYMQWTYYAICWWSKSDRWHYKTNVAWNDAVKRRFRVESLCTAETYDRHNEWVRMVAAEKSIQLFEWEPTMGWDGLCAFLGRKVPRCPFPKNNDQKHMVKVRYFLLGRGFLLWARAIMIPAVAYFALRRFRFI